MKKVIILGGAGFIGLNIAKYLVEKRSYEITIADNLSRGKMDSYLKEIIANEKVDFIEGDFTKESTFKNLENDYDYCYMLASVVGVNNALKIPSEIIRINTSLILNTFAHTMGAAGVGAQAIRIYGEQSETLIALLLTLAILYFSEIIPKTLGATFWRQLAVPSAHVINFLVKLVFPLVWISSRLTHLFSGNRKDSISRDEVLAFTALSYKEGALATQENLLVENILKLREAKTGDILTPRTVMHALSEELTVEAALNEEKTAVFSRIPIFSDNKDSITGLVLKTDLYNYDRQGKGDVLLKDICSPVHSISEALPVLNLLDFENNRHKEIEKESKSMSSSDSSPYDAAKAREIFLAKSKQIIKHNNNN